MRATRSREKASSPSVLSRTDYMALSPEERALYRPILSRYERVPILCRIIYALSALCAVLYILQRTIPAFADFFNLYVSSFFRAVLGLLTGWIPFSVAEGLLLLLPLILFVTIRYAVRYRCDTWRCVSVFVAILLSVLLSVGCLFVLNFSAGYYGSPLSDKMELDTSDIKDSELYDTAYYLVFHLNSLSRDIEYGSDGFSDMPYSVGEMNRHLNEAYSSLHEDHDFIPTFPSHAKPVLLSEGMSYLRTTGVYSFFTGEANINVAFPDFTVPYTAAHELAHQRGVAREDEANFVAFLACLKSDDAYVSYCGFLNMFQYVASAVYQRDADSYRAIYRSLRPEIQGELAAYNDFISKYEQSPVGDMSEAVNDAYLQSQGTPGTVSYNMVVKLAVGYHRALSDAGF